MLYQRESTRSCRCCLTPPCFCRTNSWCSCSVVGRYWDLHVLALERLAGIFGVILWSYSASVGEKKGYFHKNYVNRGCKC